MRGIRELYHIYALCIFYLLTYWFTGALVLVDDISLPLIGGATIDYVEEVNWTGRDRRLLVEIERMRAIDCIIRISLALRIFYSPLLFI